MPVSRFATLVLAAVFCAATGSARAAERVVEVPTRDGVTVRMIESRAESRAAPVVILFTGGNGRAGLAKWDGSGDPSGNFLVRSRHLFMKEGFHVAVPDVPSDRHDLFGWRTSRAHAEDVAAVIAHMRRLSDGPVFLVGTSRGTISAAGAAAHLPPGAVAGIVLTSTVTRHPRRSGRDRVQDADIAAIRVPVLFQHHAQDTCFVCVPEDIPGLAGAFTGAPATRIVMYEGGGPWRGDDCGPRHAHGFVGIEDKVVADAALWMREIFAAGAQRR